MNIALKEAYETLYWLTLLKDTDFLEKETYDKVYAYADELVKILASIVKSTKTTLH